MFAYEIMGNVAPVEPQKLFYYGDKIYAFVAVLQAVYAEKCRPLSVQWDTVTLSSRDFRICAKPMDYWLE